MFKHFFLSAALIMATPIAAMADPVTDVIENQLDAFLQRDMERAWSHASPMIKDIFITPDNFAQMVEQGYPIIFSSNRYTFSERVEKGPHVFQIVVVQGENGGRAAFEYDMVQLNGAWKINGVRPVPLNELAV
ncbi:uncharacterized protein DUF4864 [Pacificibacter maritimus]|uniref:Uncharacterized protein DUF4864 n=1 Tax=Pacificibacter maritimus TaxID=762213 RepID=A0A3N4V3A2_9RHOB|nr:DUF4864 domain-containing protein [Pacificibacter maritimus]RPE67424.1 uncharacterized protein DUF4864 [Pacificibacter maritimus]